MALREPKPVKDLIAGLIGREIIVALVSAGDLAERHTTGTYVDPGNRLTAAALVDVPLTAYLGAALGLLPPGRAEESIADGAVEESLMENAAEVLNVLAAVLGEELGVHQRLDRIYAPGEVRPAPVEVLAASVGSRLDLRIAIAGYGDGVLSLVAFPA